MRLLEEPRVLHPESAGGRRESDTGLGFSIWNLKAHQCSTSGPSPPTRPPSTATKPDLLRVPFPVRLWGPFLFKPRQEWRIQFQFMRAQQQLRACHSDSIQRTLRPCIILTTDVRQKILLLFFFLQSCGNWDTDRVVEWLAKFHSSSKKQPPKF